MTPLNWNTVEGYQQERPAQLDVTSSEKYVYIRKNIEERTRTDGMTGEDVTFWSYLEAKLTREDFETYAAGLSLEATLEQQALIDQANAEILLNQCDAAMTLADQDAALAEILLNTTQDEEV